MSSQSVGHTVAHCGTSQMFGVYLAFQILDLIVKHTLLLGRHLVMQSCLNWLIHALEAAVRLEDL